MKFVLKDYNRNVPLDEMINDLKQVASILGKNDLSRKEYNQYGKYNSSTIEKRVGSWSLAKQNAGLLCKTYPCSMYSNERIEDDNLLIDLKDVAKILNVSTIQYKEYKKIGKYHPSTISNRFGSWDNALLQAGLQPSGLNRIITQEDLFKEIEKLWTHLGRQPTCTDIRNGKSKYSLNTYARHLGGWRSALSKFINFIYSVPEEQFLEQDNNTNFSGKPFDNNSEIKKNSIRKTRRDINLRLRFKILSRDNFKCCSCGASPAKDPSIELHIDHVFPWVKGGETTLENLQTLCSKCNLGKGDYFIEK